jgi:DNA-binding protein H-NS
MAVDINKLSQAELEALIMQAQSRKTELHREELGKVRDDVAAYARSKGYSIDELFGKGKRAGGKRGTVPPKYRNPKDPAQTWTGRGKRPRWFQALLDSGKKDTDLLIR